MTMRRMIRFITKEKYMQLGPTEVGPFGLLAKPRFFRGFCFYK